MKKYLAILCLMCLLTSCGTIDEPAVNSPETATKAETVTTAESEAEITTKEVTTTQEVTTTAAETTIAETEKPTEPETAPKETEPIQEEPQVSVRDNVISSYKVAIQLKIDVVHGYSPNNVMIDYALYDMDKDGIPELFVKYGTCEADFQIAIYTYKNDQLKQITDELGGGHTGFAYDYVANQIVLCYGHQGYGNMSWYDLDGNGNIRFLISTDYFEYDSPNTPTTYEEYMTKYNVAWLDFSSFSDYNGSKTTWVYYHYPNDTQYEEYDGFNYRLLENYVF